jgi:hypothetical protein
MFLVFDSIDLLQQSGCIAVLVSKGVGDNSRQFVEEHLFRLAGKYSSSSGWKTSRKTSFNAFPGENNAVSFQDLLPAIVDFKSATVSSTSPLFSMSSDGIMKSSAQEISKSYAPEPCRAEALWKTRFTERDLDTQERRRSKWVPLNVID